ncbi:MAG TPA: hypothetical protein VGN47_01710 [Blastococcus sp.]|nr:hypothetical protein [Blastococcus sp.]
MTSVSNRASIDEHGLDWRRMGAAPGIAGSTCPEQEGCFLAVEEGMTDFIIRMNNTGGPVDVWEVHGIDEGDLVTSPEGFGYFPGVIVREQLRLVRRDVPPVW